MRHVRVDEGATAVEYSIMLAAIAAVIVAIVFLVGRETCQQYETASQSLANAQPGGAEAGACP